MIGKFDHKHSLVELMKQTDNYRWFLKGKAIQILFIVLFSLFIKRNIDQTSKSFKVLQPWFSAKFYLTFNLIINFSNYWRQTYVGCKLLYFYQKSSRANRKGFEYKICT